MIHVDGTVFIGLQRSISSSLSAEEITGRAADTADMYSGISIESG
jgi:hypothetical protein